MTASNSHVIFLSTPDQVNTLQLLTASLALVVTLLMGMLFALKAHHELVGKLIVMMSICIACNLLVKLPVAAEWPVFQFLIARPATALPSILWVLAFYLFTDRPKVPPFMWWLIGGHLLLRTIGVQFSSTSGVENTPLALIFYTLPQVVMLGLVLHTVHMATAGFKDDLIEKRRSVRALFVASVATLTIPMILLGFPRFYITNFYPEYADPALIDSAFSVMILLTVCCFLLLVTQVDSTLLKLNEVTDFSLDRPGSKREREIKIARHTIARIDNLMKVDRVYSQSDFSIGSLTEKIGIKEYQLRKVINTHMKYRNFAQFVNFYRLMDAREKLIVTDHPVSNIAIEVGYESLSSFHKAFKGMFDTTPREYRMRYRG